MSSHVYAPFTRNQYIAKFVQCGDPQWVERFAKVVTTQQFSFLQAAAGNAEVAERPEPVYLSRALEFLDGIGGRSAAPQVTLIAICDENRIDEEGVSDLVRKAKLVGVKPIIANPAVFDAK